MGSAQPLDRAVWNALTTRQAHLAIADGAALRFDPDYAHFATLRPGAVDGGEALIRLSRATGPVGLFEAAPPDTPSGLARIDGFLCLQMTCDTLTPGGRDLDFEPLNDTDGPEMLALATLTRPGPFLARTHRLGPFIGVLRDDRIVAMAGVRLDLDGFTEVSGVCTHPDHRGQGYAAALMRAVTAGVLERGDTAFLHVRAADAATIAFYETLGFRPRAEIEYRLLAPAT